MRNAATILKERGAEAQRSREEQARRNKADFPFASRMLDELRQAGFTGARVTYAEEGGKTVGKRLGEGVVPV